MQHFNWDLLIKSKTCDNDNTVDGIGYNYNWSCLRL